MMQNLGKWPLESERYLFYGLSFLGAIGLLRNFARIGSKVSQYVRLRQVVAQQAQSNRVLRILQGQNIKQDVILDAVLVSFKENYFQAATKAKSYKAYQTGFYDNLKFQHPFEGAFLTSKKEYRIQFQMNHPYVDFQLVEQVRQFNRRGITSKKNYQVAVYGNLRYVSKRKKAVFDTKMVTIQGISMIKYYQKYILSICISTFWFSTFIGAAIAIYLNSCLFEESPPYVTIRNLFQRILQKQIHKCQFYDDLPV